MYLNFCGKFLYSATLPVLSRSYSSASCGTLLRFLKSSHLYKLINLPSKSQCVAQGKSEKS